jgi:DNA-binding transcriptional MerR regulator
MPYLSIGQLERVLSVPASTLRFWEKTVPFLTPMRTKSGRRTYSISEVGLIARLKHLALDRGFGLQRAQRLLEFELLYEDQDYRAGVRALRDRIISLMLESEEWREAYRNFAKELCDGADDKTLDGVH